MKRLLPLLFVLIGLSSKAQIVNIPDANFKNYLLNYNPRIDTNFDNEIDVNEAAAVTLSFFINNPAISDITGIQTFINVNDLTISSPGISSLNLAGMNQLHSLSVYSTALTTLDLSVLPGLTSMMINGNQQLTTLNVNGLVNLTSLNCMSNSLTALNVGGLASLTNLNCRDNAITALNVNGLTNLTGLSCEENNINSLNITGLLNLASVSCRDNNLTSLTLSNCPAITTLYCGSTALSSHLNQLTDLDLSGLPNLITLNCDENLLTTLDLSNCPIIQQAACRNNQLTSVNVAGLTHLTDLVLPGNYLTSINVSGCSALFYLDCQNNQLASLDLSSCSLFHQLLCNYNQLTSLNISGVSNLTHLICEHNQLSSIDVSGAASLAYFACGNNQLTSLNLKNGPGVISSFYASNNPALQYVCADEAEIASLQALLIQQGLPNVSVNSYCSFTPGGTHNTISGIVKADANNNGCDAGDPVIAGMTLKIDDGTNVGYTSSTSLGGFLFYTNAGNFTITPQIPNAYFTTTPASVSFATAGSNIQTADFCIVPNGVHNDLEILIIPVSPARPGFNATYKLVYKNKGTQSLAGNVELNFEGTRANYMNAAPAVTTQTTDLLSWSYSNLQPLETRSIDVSFNILPPPVNNITDTLSYTANITPLAGDETPADNSFTMKQVLVGSMDPNDKVCMEGSRISITRVGDYVHYLVRFQNTGTYVAENVVVKDMLQNSLDWNTVELVKTSHPCIFRQTAGNKLEFIFEGINLPAQSVDEPGSHGYIAFKVKTIGSLQVGDQVSNDASIYFDFNLPVVTNAANSVISSEIIIPVSIEYFKGAIQSGRHLLNWKANCTSLQVKFDIERSTDGRTYNNIANITASNTRCLQPFDLTDNNPVAGMNYYRIKMTDVDGKVSYSSIIALLNKKAGFEIVNLLPNPVVGNSALLNITSAEKQLININVTDASGKIVQSGGQSIISGFTAVDMNFSKLASGVYSINIYTSNGERRTTQFIKQ